MQPLEECTLISEWPSELPGPFASARAFQVLHRRKAADVHAASVNNHEGPIS